MDEKILKLDDVIWIGKLVDTNTHTFLYKKQYYKATLQNSLFHNSEEFGIILSKISDRGFIPRTHKVNIKMDRYATVYHQKTDFFTVP